MAYFPLTGITDTNGSAIALGQATKSASLPVTIASDQNAIQAKTLASQAEVAFSTTTAQSVATTDAGAQGYQGVSVHITSQGTSSTVTFQTSNDNTNWVSSTLMLSSSIQSVGVVSTTTTGLYYGNINARYFRLNVSGITAGTTVGVIEFYNSPLSFPSIGGTISAAGGIASGTADSGSPVKVGAKYNATPPTFTDGQRGDAQIDSKGNLRSVIMDAAGNARGVNVTAANAAQSDITSVSGTAITLGQKTASASFPVTLASDNGITQSAVSPGTTTAPSATIVVAGKTNDATAKYSILPLGANGVSLLTQPYTGANVSGTATTTTTTDTQVVAAQGAGIKYYLTGYTIYNSGASASVITFKNGSGGATLWTTLVPAGGAMNMILPAPVATGANVGLFFAAATASTTIGVAVTGYTGA